MNNSGRMLDYLKTLTVLYVEDDAETRAQFTEFLQRMVGRLITAEDGTDGLQKFLDHQPRIVITDVQMPGMDGLSLSRQIHEHDPAVPIIIITAFEKLDYMLQATTIGVEKYVTKPVQSNNLLQCLTECAWLVFEQSGQIV